MRTLARNLSIGLLVSSAAMTVFLWECGYAQAEDAQCGPHDALIKGLADQYHEGIVSQATAAKGKLMIELTVSAAGTWTLIGTTLEGTSCIRAFGDDWTKIAEPPKPGTPS